MTVTVTTPPTVWPSPAHGELTGPWDQGFYFTLTGPVRSKSNYRQDTANRGKWTELSGFADQVFLAARASRPRGWVAGDPGAPVAQRPKILTCVFARTMLDIGNIDKSILDAVEAPRGRGAARAASPGVVMVNDAQVAASVSWGVRTSEDVGALVAFARVAPDITPAQVARASAALLTQCAELLDGP